MDTPAAGVKAAGGPSSVHPTPVEETAKQGQKRAPARSDLMRFQTSDRVVG